MGLCVCVYVRFLSRSREVVANEYDAVWTGCCRGGGFSGHGSSFDLTRMNIHACMYGRFIRIEMGQNVLATLYECSFDLQGMVTIDI